MKCELKREWWGGWKVNLFLLCADSRAGQDVTLCSGNCRYGRDQAHTDSKFRMDFDLRREQRSPTLCKKKKI